MKLLALIKRNLKEIIRDRVAIGFMLAFPIVFMVILGLVFGGSRSFPISLRLVNEDHSQLSEAFINLLKDSKVFELKFYDNRLNAEEGVKVGEVFGMLVLPRDFGEEASAYFQGAPTKIPLYLSYDVTNIQVGAYLENLLTALGQAFFQVKQPLSLEINPIERKIKKPALNFFAAAYSIFGMMTLIAAVASFWVTDRQKGWLSRLWTTPLSSKDFLSGYSIPFLSLVLLLPFFYLGVAFAMGARLVGNFFLVLLPIWLTGILCIGLGMVVASLVKNPAQAAGLSWLIVVPLAMISGVFFPAEGMPSYMQRVAEFLPFGYAVEAGRLVMSRGAGLAAIKGDLFVILIWITLIYLINLPLLRRLMRA